MEENLPVQNKIDNFRERFEAVGVAANQFDSVKEDIITSLDEAHEQVNELKLSSEMVETHFEEIKDTFTAFQTSVQEIKECMEKVSATYGVFDKITAAVQNTKNVQEEISNAIELTESELNLIHQTMNTVNQQHQEVLEHINNANKLGTTKSSLFEDMDNMLIQIAPIIADLQK